MANRATIRTALRIERWSGGAVRAETLVSDEDRQLLDRLPPAPMPAIAASAGAGAMSDGSLIFAVHPHEAGVLTLSLIFGDGAAGWVSACRLG